MNDWAVLLPALVVAVLLGIATMAWVGELRRQKAVALARSQRQAIESSCTICKQLKGQAEVAQRAVDRHWESHRQALPK